MYLFVGIKGTIFFVFVFVFCSLGSGLCSYFVYV